MSLPGMLPPGSLPGGANTAGMSENDLWWVKNIQAASESCAFKTVFAGGAGFGLGMMFGLFMSSMRYDTPLTPQGAELTSLPIRQQLKVGLRDMGKQSLSTGRNFALVGSIFAGTECCIEGLRAKNDIYNGVAGGCITGAILSRRAGPQAMLLGGVGFGVFSLAIDWWMRSPESENRLPVI